MQIRECLDLIARLTEASDPAITGAYIEKAYALLDAEADLEPVGLHLSGNKPSGFADSLVNTVEIVDISVDEDHQSEGLGAKTMKILCALADTMSVTLVLRTWDSDQMDLDGWYSQFGFQGSRKMYRLPQAATNA